VTVELSICHREAGASPFRPGRDGQTSDSSNLGVSCQKRLRGRKTGALLPMNANVILPACLSKQG